MDPTVIAAIITILGTIAAAVIGVWNQRRPTGDSGHVSGRQPGRAVFWLLVAGLIVAWAVVGLMVVGGLQDQALKVPSLKGRTLEAARQRVGENFKIISSGEASRQPEDVIVSQNSNAGTEVRRGEKIAVVVSTGPKIAPGPKPAPGYDLVEDPTGSLRVEVPSSWEVEMGEASERQASPRSSWSYYLQGYLVSSITTPQPRGLVRWPVDVGRVHSSVEGADAAHRRRAYP
jgi:PASTA domain